MNENTTEKATREIEFDSSEKIDAYLNLWTEIIEDSLEYNFVKKSKLEKNTFEILSLKLLYNEIQILEFFNKNEASKLLELDYNIQKEIFLVSDDITVLKTNIYTYVEFLLDFYKQSKNEKSQIVELIKERFDILINLGVIDTNFESDGNQKATDFQIKIPNLKNYYLRRRLELYNGLKTKLVLDETQYSKLLNSDFTFSDLSHNKFIY